MGVLVLSTSVLLIGGDESIINEEYQFIFIVVGFLTLGFSNSFMAIPCLPEMIDSIDEDKKLNHLYDREILHGVVSGLFVSFQNFGEIIGPVLGSSLAEAYGFTIAQNICASFLLFYSLLYFISCGNIQMFKKP